MLNVRESARCFVFFFSSRRRHTRCSRDWSSDVCSSDLRLADRGSTMSDDPRRSSEGKHEFAVIGRPLPKIDAWAKVIGETKYADDLFLPRMAYGRLLRSPHGHALIKRIDTSQARALPGVYAVITGSDLPHVKFGILPVSQDEEALCTEK